MEKKYKFIDIFCEDNGHPSTMRVLVSFIVFMIMFNWTYCIFISGVYFGLSWSSIAVLIGVLAAKGYQKKEEKKV